MFTGVLMGGYLLYRVLKNKSLMLEMMQTMGQKNLPEFFIIKLEKDMAYFLIAYGFFMLPVAILSTTSQWLFFKTAGFYIATFFVFIYEFWWFKKYLRKI
jgi:intracellular septation protein A